MVNSFAFYSIFLLLLAIGDEEGVLSENDSDYEQGDQSNQPLGCINFKFLLYILCVMIAMNLICLCLLLIARYLLMLVISMSRS